MKLEDMPVMGICGEAGGERWSFEVGKNRVTKITVEEVAGQMAMVPWFSVWMGEELAWRENAAHVHSVQYKSEG